MCKCLSNLVIKIFTVGNYDNFRVTACKFHEDIFRKHYHCKGLSAALSVPYNTTLTIAVLIVGVDSLYYLSDSEKLLMSAYLLYVGIKDYEILCKLHKPVPVKERHDIPVLLSDTAVGDML